MISLISDLDRDDFILSDTAIVARFKLSEHNIRKQHFEWCCKFIRTLYRFEIEDCVTHIYCFGIHRVVWTVGSQFCNIDCYESKIKVIAPNESSFDLKYSHPKFKSKFFKLIEICLRH